MIAKFQICLALKPMRIIHFPSQMVARQIPGRDRGVPAGKFFGAPKLLRKTDHFSSVKPDGYDHPAHELLVDFYHDYFRSFFKNGSKSSSSEPPAVAPPVPSEAKLAPAANSFEPSADIISALPEIDPQVSFVGREDLLRDFNGALKGILFESKRRTGSPRTESRAIWLDGPGGMGKSSLLRRACLEAKMHSAPQPKVGLVDFDVRKPDWHRPGQTRLADPRDLFDAIAYALLNSMVAIYSLPTRR